MWWMALGFPLRFCFDCSLGLGMILCLFVVRKNYGRLIHFGWFKLIQIGSLFIWQQRDAKRCEECCDLRSWSSVASLDCFWLTPNMVVVDASSWWFAAESLYRFSECVPLREFRLSISGVVVATWMVHCCEISHNATDRELLAVACMFVTVEIPCPNLTRHWQATAMMGPPLVVAGVVRWPRSQHDVYNLNLNHPSLLSPHVTDLGDLAGKQYGNCDRV